MYVYTFVCFYNYKEHVNGTNQTVNTYYSVVGGEGAGGEENTLCIVESKYCLVVWKKKTKPIIYIFKNYHYIFH